MTDREPPVFFFDVGSPYAYLSAERIDALLPGVLWQPILLGGVFKATGRSSWAMAEPWRRELGMHEIERRASEYGLPAIRWPAPWPSSYVTAQRAVTFAFSIGHGRQFTLAAFRAMFVDGIDISVDANLLKVTWDLGLDPSEVAEGAADPETKTALRRATQAALSAGVRGVPTVQVGRRLFWGDDELAGAVSAARS